MALRRIPWKRVLLGTLALALVAGGAFLVYGARRHAREREIDRLVAAVCGDDRAAHEAALAECARIRDPRDIRYMARLLAESKVDARHIVPALAVIGEPAFRPVVDAVGYPPEYRDYDEWPVSPHPGAVGPGEWVRVRRLDMGARPGREW